MMLQTVADAIVSFMYHALALPGRTGTSKKPTIHMRVTLKHYLAVVGLLLAGAGTYYIMRGKSEPVSPRMRNPVQVVKSILAEQKTIPINIAANGYVTPIDTVDVRPQVQNVVRAVHVREGQQVRAGQLLITLDERNDLSTVEKNRAQLARDRADLADAEATLKRNQELFAKNFVAQAVVDSARSKVEALHATLRADEAAAKSGNITLGYNRISASIAGRIGTINVHPGSLAQPAGTPMLTISQLDPIAVSFTVPERELVNITATYPNGDAPVTANTGSGKEVSGKLIFIDNIADQQSGTIKMKAQFANSDHAMWPGAFVGVRLVSRSLPDAVVVPAQAIVTGPTEKFVFVVQPDDTVKMQKIEVLALEEGQAAIKGLSAGARIVVEGTQNLRPGSKVKEIESTAQGAAAQEKKQGGKRAGKQTPHQANKRVEAP
jgi:RND family efflux transporter MFP subunit